MKYCVQFKFFLWLKWFLLEPCLDSGTARSAGLCNSGTGAPIWYEPTDILILICAFPDKLQAQAQSGCFLYFHTYFLCDLHMLWKAAEKAWQGIHSPWEWDHLCTYLLFCYIYPFIPNWLFCLHTLICPFVSLGVYSVSFLCCCCCLKEIL